MFLAVLLHSSMHGNLLCRGLHRVLFFLTGAGGADKLVEPAAVPVAPGPKCGVTVMLIKVLPILTDISS